MSGQTPGNGGPDDSAGPDAELDGGIEREDTAALGNGDAGAASRQLPLALKEGKAPGEDIPGAAASTAAGAGDADPYLGGSWIVDMDVEVGGGDAALPRGAGAIPPPSAEGESPALFGAVSAAAAREGDGADGDIPMVTIDYEAPLRGPTHPARRPDGGIHSLPSSPWASEEGVREVSAGGEHRRVPGADWHELVALDAENPAGGTLNHLLGTPRPARGFGSFLRGRAETLDELAVDTPVAGVRLVAARRWHSNSRGRRATARPSWRRCAVSRRMRWSLISVRRIPRFVWTCGWGRRPPSWSPWPIPLPSRPPTDL